MMAARFDATNGVPTGVLQPLFKTDVGTDNHPYAVDANGQRFLFPIASDPPVVAVMDWRALLNR